uniref:Glycine zipper 2TM domain-containing protein n=1 Tax=Panagrolaimus davidi TaxID=227884 RepID=A0A914Q0U5_9BILA
MEVKILCCVLIVILAISIPNIYALDETELNPKFRIRAERGVIKDALKGAVVGAVGSKVMGGSAKTGAVAGAAGGAALGATKSKHHDHPVVTA